MAQFIEVIKKDIKRMFEKTVAEKVQGTRSRENKYKFKETNLSTYPWK